MKKVLASGVLAITAAFTLTVAAVPPASAAVDQCVGTATCDNKYPDQTTNNGHLCSDGAYTPGGGQRVVFNGLLELRYGPNCGVNWARFNPYSSDGQYYLWVQRESDGFNTYGDQFFGWQGDHFSRQVYSPVARSRACVFRHNGTDWGQAECTAWI
ncbi:hypothetical protein ACQP1V_18715 [Microtetraspora malaysiensis]|uniref:hypothetical protein n=1 Tax=Microtetraspora malaysiensis TaxID=161358 RepID=UPI003D8BD6BB